MAAGTQVAPSALRGRRGMSRVALRNTFYGVFFALPWIIGLLGLYAYPIAASFYFSFLDYNGLQSSGFVGLDNYRYALSGQDPQFWTAVYNTAYYTGIAVPAGIIVALTVALMLNMRVRGQFIYRTIYFIPILVPEVALSIVWVQMFNPQFGVINVLLEGAGKMAGLELTGPGWITSQYWSKPTLVLMNMWLIGQAMVIYLAGLQDVPQDLYDAASVDGANTWHKVRFVTIPMITPVIFFNLVISMIAAMQFFTQPWVMTGGLGTPANSLLFYGMLLYRYGFVFFKFGLASAVAWLLFLVILVLTGIIFRSSRAWVYYGGESR